MICPRCSAGTTVSDTRLTKGRMTRRMRHCKNKKCGYSFPTREVAIDELERLWTIEKRVKEFSALLAGPVH
jgi:transcriptional regulator NrdR family protein